MLLTIEACYLTHKDFNEIQNKNYEKQMIANKKEKLTAKMISFLK